MNAVRTQTPAQAIELAIGEEFPWIEGLTVEVGGGEVVVSFTDGPTEQQVGEIAEPLAFDYGFQSAIVNRSFSEKFLQWVKFVASAASGRDASLERVLEVAKRTAALS